MLGSTESISGRHSQDSKQHTAAGGEEHASSVV